ncbi:MAG: GAF domain-containing protein [Chloroflexi bacterium]|nr:GAF domain-containing protein [Chloroflexota bacterium]
MMTIVAAVIAAVYLVLLGITLQRRTRRDPAEGWLLLFSGYSALLMGAHAVIGTGTLALSASFSSRHLLTILFMGSLMLTGFLTLTYINKTGREMLVGWGILSGLATAAVVVTIITGSPSVTGLDSLLQGAMGGESIRLAAEIALGSWLLLALMLFVGTIHSFLTEPLPLYANRILLWGVVAPLILLGDALSLLPSEPWFYIGYGLRLVGAALGVYGVISTRILDIRATTRWLISRSIITVITSVLILGGIIVTINLAFGENNVSPWLIGAGMALLVALILQPARDLMRFLMRRLIDRDTTDPAEAVRLYVQRVASVIEIKELAETASATIKELFNVRQAILISARDERIFISLDNLNDDTDDLGRLALNSPIYRHFVDDGRPLLQYDIDYAKEYRDVPDTERRYFGNLGMDLYAPIVDDHTLIGMLAVGPKSSDDQFYPRELELLSALAQQTVVALENARLVRDLRNLNAAMNALNEDLRLTNARLERLDAVKTDFLAIASHELRTPLTQVQGYADLLAEMANRHFLTPEQVMDITSHLSNSTRRMTEVIASMLDISQIDVENMDLNFVETNVANIMKLAIDPYAEDLETRNLSLTARGLRQLPPIYADYKRLVQAFQNLITNAIKYTPDGGKILINGDIHERSKSGEPLSIQIVIEDSGIGIDKADQELIFEKFFRVGSVELHSTGSTKFKGAGPGLGLPIAQGIINGHGGRIWIESEGHDEERLPGSKFHVVLPVRPEAMDARQSIDRIQQTLQSAEEAAKEQTIIRSKANAQNS